MSVAQPVDSRIVISSLWATLLFVFAYVDIFGLFRADVLQLALGGKVSTFDVGQTFLALTTLYVVVPSLMIFLTLVLPRALNRGLNITLAVLYSASIVGSCVGEIWIYYLMGSAIEVVLLAVVGWRAWKTL